MAVTMSAKVTKDNVTFTVQNMGKAVAPQKVAEIVGRKMVQSFFPTLFESNLYQWPQPLRGGMPLRDTSTHLASAFSWSTAGNICTIKNSFRYAHIHDKGATIHAKNERTVVQNCTSKNGKKFTRTLKMKVLAFKVGDEWRYAKSVKIPRRRFMFWSASATRFAKERVAQYLKTARTGKAEA